MAPTDRLVTLPETRWVDLLHPWPDRTVPLVWDLDAPADSLGVDLQEVEMVVLPYLRPAVQLNRLAELPGLRLVQTLTAGYDGVVEALPRGVQLANAAGVHDASTAELTVGLLIARLRGLDDAARDLASHTWAPRVRRSLADRHVLLVGAGSVGEAIRRRLDPFEVTVTRVASTARDDAIGHVHGTAQLLDLLPDHDVVVLACPLTERTRGLVDAGFLARMPDGALLVNVSRGPVVRTAALVAELATGRLRAALDVVDPEPLPADHPLWDVPGLLLTPHVGGASTAMEPRAVALLRAQLDRLVEGESPRNVVAVGVG